MNTKNKVNGIEDITNKFNSIYLNEDETKDVKCLDLFVNDEYFKWSCLLHSYGMKKNTNETIDSMKRRIKTHATTKRKDLIKSGMLGTLQQYIKENY